MDGEARGGKPPLELRREFTSSRLEAQVLTQAYEAIVPVVRRPVPTAQTLWDTVDAGPEKTSTTRMAQGA